MTNFFIFVMTIMTNSDEKWKTVAMLLCHLYIVTLSDP